MKMIPTGGGILRLFADTAGMGFSLQLPERRNTVRNLARLPETDADFK